MGRTGLLMSVLSEWYSKDSEDSAVSYQESLKKASLWFNKLGDQKDEMTRDEVFEIGYKLGYLANNKAGNDNK